VNIVLELTPSEELHYKKLRQSLLEHPENIIQDFSDQWLRVVGEVGVRALEDLRSPLAGVEIILVA